MWTTKLKRLDHNSTLQYFAALWGSDRVQPILVNNGINTVFYFTFRGKPRFLRITHNDLRATTQLDAAIAYNQHLFDQNIPVAEPLVSIEGRYVEKIQQGEDTFLAHAVKGVPGEPVKIEKASSALLENWGKSLAQLHQASTCYHPYQNYKFQNWSDVIEEFSPWTTKESIKIQEEFAEVNQKLQDLSRTASNYGLTHGDHRCGNVLSTDKQVWFIDFDDPVYNWFAADIARPFFDMYITQAPGLSKKLIPFLEGYESVNPSADLAFNNIHLFLRFKALDIYLWTINKWDSLTAPGGGSVENWMKNIKQAIEKSEKLTF